MWQRRGGRGNRRAIPMSCSMEVIRSRTPRGASRAHSRPAATLRPARLPRLYTETANRLMAAGCVAADDEADELIAAAPDDESLEMWIRRREQGEPLPWITGTTRFCGHTLR